MKIFTFSDLHKSDAGLEFVLKTIKSIQPDLILNCGDVTTFGPKSFAEKAISALPMKSFGVPGNCDPPEIHDVYDLGNSTNLHGISTEFEGFVLVGWGGSSISLNTPFENPESFIKSNLSPVIKEASENVSKPVILISHCPPNGILDEIPNGMHVGCTSIAEVVDEYRPSLTICGHIHEAKGIFRDEIRNLIVVNTGPAKLHSAAVIELAEPKKVKESPLDGITIELLS